jgi:hypothetical protein
VLNATPEGERLYSAEGFVRVEPHHVLASSRLTIGFRHASSAVVGQTGHVRWRPIL